MSRAKDELDAAYAALSKAQALPRDQAVSKVLNEWTNVQAAWARLSPEERDEMTF